MTTDQVRAQTKDVTRRVGWKFLKPGDLVQPVKKGMGLKPGEKVEKIGPPIRIASVTREPLRRLVDDTDYGFREVAREGFKGHPQQGWPSTFAEWFAASHGCTLADEVTRIEFTYTEPK